MRLYNNAELYIYSMKCFTLRFFYSWLSLLPLLFSLAISWKFQAEFGIPRVDGSVWSVGPLVSEGFVAAYIFFYLKKKQDITIAELTKVALESLMLITVWIVWLAPIIWNYKHVAELDHYIKLSILYWITFFTFFVIGIFGVRNFSKLKGIYHESDLNLYPELALFFPDRIGFCRINHDREKGYYSFCFQTSLEMQKYFFDKVKHDAETDGWILENSSMHSVSFRKSLYPSPPAYYDHLVTLTMDRDTGEIIFVMEPFYLKK